MMLDSLVYDDVRSICSMLPWCRRLCLNLCRPTVVDGIIWCMTLSLSSMHCGG